MVAWVNVFELLWSVSSLGTFFLDEEIIIGELLNRETP